MNIYANDIEKALLQALEKAIPTGRENAIHQVDLAELLNVKPAVVKRIIRVARNKGVFICSDACGYYFPANTTEKRRWVIMMYKQAISRFSSSKCMNLSLKDVEGQISLTDDLQGISEGVTDNGEISDR